MLPSQLGQPADGPDNPDHHTRPERAVDMLFVAEHNHRQEYRELQRPVDQRPDRLHRQSTVKGSAGMRSDQPRAYATMAM